jgi:hypothetical protein
MLFFSFWGIIADVGMGCNDGVVRKYTRILLDMDIDFDVSGVK